MADRILTFQQNSVLQDVEQFLDLSKRGGSSKVLREIFLSILALVDDEKKLYPDELHPEKFFAGKVVFGTRASRPVVRLYLHKLHRHLDLLNKKTVRRG